MSRILIIDDQSTSRQILEELVANLDEWVSTESFADPVVALAWVHANPPDLVLTVIFTLKSHW